MTKLEKIKEDIEKIDEKISVLETKKKMLSDKAMLEESEQLQKIMKERNISFSELMNLLDS